MIEVPSPAISIVGRHNSGKTTLIERIIACLVSRGFDVGSVKHHSHDGFDIDYPGKDSYRHRKAGASETVIVSPTLTARVKTLQREAECKDIVRSMPGHDIVVVEGYRKSGLPSIEIMRSGNPFDLNVARAFLQGAQEGMSLGSDFVQQVRTALVAASVAEADTDTDATDDIDKEKLRSEALPPSCRLASSEGTFEADMSVAGASAAQQRPSSAQTALKEDDLAHKMPTASTVAVVTDIAAARKAAHIYGIPAFALDDIVGIADFLEKHYVRPRISLVIQAGGESRRMGRSKATVPFEGRPLICRMVERLSAVADELIITTNEPENLGFLHESYPKLGIRLVRDFFDVRGALPGLFTALSAASNSYVAVIACDMVFASARLVVAESLAMAQTDSDIVIPVNSHGYEPFHALYRKDSCLPSLKSAIDAGRQRAQSFLEDPRLKVFHFTQERVFEVEPRGGCFINANTPEDLKNLENAYLGE